ncbi:MAG: carboxypeptidase regulatory-like domain-containing protein [Planctomycetota bacterium]
MKRVRLLVLALVLVGAPLWWFTRDERERDAPSAGGRMQLTDSSAQHDEGASEVRRSPGLQGTLVLGEGEPDVAAKAVTRNAESDADRFVSARVLTSEGVVVADALVEIWAGTAWAPAVRTDAQGRFRLLFGTSSSPTLRIRTPTHALPARSSVVFGEGMHTLVLEPIVEVDVLVRDATSHQPVADAAVRLEAPRVSWPLDEGVTAEDGVARLRIAPGRVTVVVTSAQHAPYASDVYPAVAPRLGVTAELERGGTIVGIVRDAGGQVVDGASIAFEDHDSSFGATRTNAAGRYRLEHVTQHDPEFSFNLVWVKVTHDVHGSVRVVAPRPRPGEVIERDVNFPPVVQVTGTAYTTSGERLDAGRLTLSPTPSRELLAAAYWLERFETSVGRDGSFTFLRAPSGPVQIRGISAEGMDLGTIAVVVPTPPPASARIDFRPAAVEAMGVDRVPLVVQVAGPDGEGLRDVEVAWDGEGDTGGQADTNRAGEVTFQVPRGRVNVHAHRPGWVGMVRTLDVRGPGPHMETLAWPAGLLRGRVVTGNGAAAQLSVAIAERLPESDEDEYWTEVSIQTDTEGRFQVLGLRADAAYSLRVDDLGILDGPVVFGPSEDEVVWVVGTEAEAQRRLPRIQIVLDGPHRPEEVSVTIRALDGYDEYWPLDRVGDPHVFLVPARPPPTVDVRVHGEDVPSVDLLGVELRPGPEPTVLHVKFPLGHRIYGRLVDEAGQPMADVHIAGGDGQVFSDRDGRFELTGLRVGTLVLRFHGLYVTHDDLVIERVVEVVPGKLDIGDLVLRRLGALRVTSAVATSAWRPPEVRAVRDGVQRHAPIKTPLHFGPARPDSSLPPAHALLCALEPGAWRVRVHELGKVKDLGVVEIRSGETTTVAYERE